MLFRSKASAVPTGLSRNPLSNSLNIGELTGFPFEQGAATVFSLDDAPNATPIEKWAGFSLMTDVAAGADGSLYVLEYASNFFKSTGVGSIWRIAPNGDRRQIISGLTRPTGLAVDSDGVLYVTNNADGINGQLLRFSPAPGPLPLLGAWAAWSRSRVLRQHLRRPRCLRRG